MAVAIASISILFACFFVMIRIGLIDMSNKFVVKKKSPEYTERRVVREEFLEL